jgi:hypothetical protein
MSGEKMYADRVKKIKLLERTFGGKVLTYLTSDKNGFETQIAQDAIDLIIDHLDNIGVVKRIILFLYTRGGLTSAAWNIVNLLRMFCDELFVVVPHKAHSAGTMICLGADKIIMTKQATLSPIDPSIIMPLNPVSSDSNTPIPVSVEAVKAYIDLARKEFSLDTEEALANVMMKLSDHVHPLVLGEVYRSREQIKMLASKLLLNHSVKEEDKQRIINFLCSDSGSHDYTINRREAKKELKLNVGKPNEKQYKIIKDIYDDYSNELGLNQVFDPRVIQGAFAVRRGFIESIDGGSDYFISEGSMVTVTAKGKQQAIQTNMLFEGWRHEKEKTSVQEVIITTTEGDVQYEQDDTFKL